MFDEELKNKYIFNNRVAEAKTRLEKWHPKMAAKILKKINLYNLAVLGSINMDVINKDGIDTYEQIVKLINKYSSEPIKIVLSKKQLLNKSLTLLKKWNPDTYENLLEELSDDELIKLSKAKKDHINYYGVDSVESIRTCIKLSEKTKSNQKVEFFEGSTNEFLYNTFISYMKMKHQLVISEITADNFDYYFFDDLMDKMTDLYINHKNK